MSTIEVDGLGFDFGSLQVLREITFRVDSGDIIAFVGPSGCGKTTLLRCVCGLLQPTTGSVSLGTRSEDRHKLCSFVFQRTTLLPWLTVRENLALPFALQELPIPEHEMMAYLHSFGLTGFADHFPSALSVGMGQRVAFARALSENRRILLLDEPFAGLDELTKRGLATVLAKTVTAKSLAAILVTHSIHEAVFLANSVFVLSARPSTVVKEVPITLNRPRSEELWLHESLFPYIASVRSALESKL